jgi:hypothetical protein
VEGAALPHFPSALGGGFFDFSKILPQRSTIFCCEGDDKSDEVVSESDDNREVGHAEATGDFEEVVGLGLAHLL